MAGSEDAGIYYTDRDGHHSVLPTSSPPSYRDCYSWNFRIRGQGAAKRVNDLNVQNRGDYFSAIFGLALGGRLLIRRSIDIAFSEPLTLPNNQFIFEPRLSASSITQANRSREFAPLISSAIWVSLRPA